MPNDDVLRQHLVKLLTGSDAHADFERTVADFPAELRGKTPKWAEHSAWQLLEHLRIAQWDILEFSRIPEHKSPGAGCPGLDSETWDLEPSAP